MSAARRGLGRGDGGSGSAHLWIEHGPTTTTIFSFDPSIAAADSCRPRRIVTREASGSYNEQEVNRGRRGQRQADGSAEGGAATARGRRRTGELTGISCLRRSGAIRGS